MIFAVDQSLSSPLVSTNIQVVLAFIIIVSWGIIGYLIRFIQKLLREKDDIQERRLSDKIEAISKYQEYMGESSRTFELLASKLKDK